MNNEEMKELYATGEWICVGFDLNSPYIIQKPRWRLKTTQYKLIHIKHKEVLDHVLSGGVVKVNNITFNETNFFEWYYSKADYEIIPTEPKQDLNGHYCLATKEHYDKLVKDGLNRYTSNTKMYHEWKYFNISNDGKFSGAIKNPCGKPMHLHNNEWVKGSLEHEEVKYKGATCRGSYSLGTACGKCEKCKDELARRVATYLKWSEGQDNPKPVERITREEIDEMREEINSFMNTVLHPYIEYNDYSSLMDMLSALDTATDNYIDANQKDK